MSEDRTSEFLSLAKALPQDRLQAKPASITSSGIGPGGNDTETSAFSGRYGRSAAATNNPAFEELRTFHQTASGISRDIAATSHMLQELTQLVRNKSLFVDDSQRVNVLVHNIKTSVENLNGRLEQASTTIQYQKRRLGRNSQAGQEASNLVGQLKTEFVEATAGFKKVLQQRTDNIKETKDQKQQVYGGNVDFVSLDNKPPVYGGPGSVGADGAGAGAGAANAFPTLDLTSGMSAGEPTGSSGLPRPRKYTFH